MSTPQVQFVPVDTDPGQHAVSDPRKPTKYAVQIDGVTVGHVASHSSESWDHNRSGTIRTRYRGLSRSWKALGLHRERLGLWSTRARAAEEVAKHHAATPQAD